VEALIKAYEKKNVFFMQFLGGDEEIPNIDFKKHYRLSCPVIPDNLDSLRHIIRVSGITNVGVFGADGICTFNKGCMEESPGGFEKVIDAALEKAKGPGKKAGAFIDGGTVYPPEVKKQGRIIRQRTPDLAPGADGEVFLVYASDESGSNDVMFRSSKGGAWGKEVKVAATKADEYSPAVVSAGMGAAVVAYVSNEKGLYDIFTVIVKGGKPQKPQQLTHSKNDAMAPHLARGEKGDIWLAWYEWAKMGSLSRDREIFVSRLSSAGWSTPMQVSPREVPTYEDHADPVVAPDGKGGAWVAWAWDYHGTLRRKVPVDENSIFARHIEPDFKLGQVLAVGYRGQGRARDYVPSMVVARDGVPWVAWDNSHKSSLGPDAKAIFVNQLAGEDFGEQTEAAASKGQIDSPGIFLDPRGGLHLVWCQEGQKGWELWYRGLGPKAKAEPMKIPVKGKNPRHPKACFDSKGKPWVAYTDATSPKWQVFVEAIGS